MSAAPTARRAAAEILGRVLRHGRFLDDALAEAPSFAPLEGRDRAFARLLAATVLRRLGQIDAVLAARVSRPLGSRDAGVEDALRLGAAQLLFLNVPAHAAVGETVELVPPPRRAVVNAVLRRIGREGMAALDGQDAPRLDTPDWLWRRWADAFGEAAARAIAEAHLAEPPLDLSVREDPEGWAGRLDGTLLPTGTVRRPAGGRVEDLPGYAEGAWWVQDMAAALPVRLLGDVAGSRVIDLCAAPGGKTAQLCAAGARVTAVEGSARRAERLRTNLVRLGFEAEVVVADAARWRPDVPADAVLLDAPCSGTGAIRRHPDIQRLKGPADPPRMAEAQDRLLRAALDMVRPGGRVIFCTCSLEPEEGPQRIAALLAGGAPARRLPIAAEELAGLGELVDQAGDLRTHPGLLAGIGGLDGFYACRLERSA